MKKRIVAILLTLAVVTAFSLAPLSAGWLRYSEYIYYPCPQGGVQAACTIGTPLGCIPFGCGPYTP